MSIVTSLFSPNAQALSNAGSQDEKNADVDGKMGDYYAQKEKAEEKQAASLGAGGERDQVERQAAADAKLAASYDHRSASEYDRASKEYSAASLFETDPDAKAMDLKHADVSAKMNRFESGVAAAEDRQAASDELSVFDLRRFLRG
jgi:hypothetical protein